MKIVWSHDLGGIRGCWLGRKRGCGRIFIIRYLCANVSLTSVGIDILIKLLCDYIVLKT